MLSWSILLMTRYLSTIMSASMMSDVPDHVFHSGENILHQYTAMSREETLLKAVYMSASSRASRVGSTTSWVMPFKTRIAVWKNTGNYARCIDTEGVLGGAASHLLKLLGVISPNSHISYNF